MRRPCICILASTGWEVRNILMSRALKNIPPQQDVDVICPYAENEEFRQRFANFRTLAKMPEWGLEDYRFIVLICPGNVFLENFFFSDPPIPSGYAAGHAQPEGQSAETGAQEGDPRTAGAPLMAPQQEDAAPPPALFPALPVL